MRGRFIIVAGAIGLGWSGMAQADASASFDPGQRAESQELQPYLQCVPYARERSGVQIYGDARTWWDQAAGRYKRGIRPRAGAVMTFRPSGAMTLGHVAAVARVIDDRTVLLDHANWSPIGGRRGQIERGVKAVDVSPANDWSQVRVWYDPIGGLGTTAWPVAGFIYNERDNGDAPLGGPRVLASAGYSAHAVQPPISAKPTKRFAAAFASLESPRVEKPAPRRVALMQAPVRTAGRSASGDPIATALARYDR